MTNRIFDTQRAANTNAIFDAQVASAGTPRRALTCKAGKITTVLDSELGTGLRPLVYLSGRLKLRSTTEGVPVLSMAGRLRLLQAGETLEA